MSKPAEPSNPNLSKTTGPLGNVVGGKPEAVSAPKSVPQTTAKAKTDKGTAPAGEPSRAKKASAQVDAHSVLETARAAVQNLAQHNANQAQRLGVELARAEQAFPLVMMEAYAKEKQTLQEAGLDAQSFLYELSQQAESLADFDTTITLSATAQRPVLAGSEPAS